MPSDSPFPVPDDTNFIMWAQANKEGIKEMVQFINRFYHVQVSVTLPTQAAPFSLIDSDSNTLLALPFKFPSTVLAPSGGTVIDIQARAQLTALLTAMHNVGIN